MEKAGVCEFLGNYKSICKNGCKQCIQKENSSIELCLECNNFADWYYNSDRYECLSKKCEEYGWAFDKSIGCVRCPSNCTKCKKLDIKFECTECDTNFGYGLNDTTLLCEFKECPQGMAQLGDVTNSYCRPCGANIAQCVKHPDNNNQIKILICNADYTLLNNKCILSTILSNCDFNSGKYYGFNSTGLKEDCYMCSDAIIGCKKCKYDYQNRKVICEEKEQNVDCTKDENGNYRRMYSAKDSLGNLICLPCTPGCLLCDSYNPILGYPPCKICFDKQSENYYPLRLDTETRLCVLNTFATGAKPKPNFIDCSVANDPKQYVDYYTNQCVNCPSDCGECEYNLDYFAQRPVKCKGCPNNYGMINNLCVRKDCTVGLRVQIGDNGTQTCVPCTTTGCSKCYMDFASQPYREICIDCGENLPTKDGCAPRKQCPKVSDIDQYLVITQVGTQDYDQKCIRCKTGCLGCQLQDAMKRSSRLICSSCSDNFILKSGDCIPSYMEEEISCVEGQYKILDTTSNPPTQKCLQCSQNCISCQNDKMCLKCQIGYHPETQASSKTQTCIKDSCPDGQFLYIYDTTKYLVKCMQCSQNCQSCKLTNSLDLATLICDQCAEGFTVSGSKCRQVLAENQTVAQICGIGKYGILSSGMVSCMPCPSGCTACLLNNDNKIICSTCVCEGTGFSLDTDNNMCKPKFNTNQYLEKSNCEILSCHPSCSGCKDGSTPDKCSSCAKGYSMGKNGCERIQVTKVVCPWNSTQQGSSCKCNDNLFLITKDSKLQCITLEELVGVNNCGTGEFFNNGQCTRCIDSNCQLCTGGTSADCKQCLAGYYLSSTYECATCSEGCQNCVNQNECLICQDGWYRYKIQSTLGSFQFFCKQTMCPDGQLPILASLYRLNPLLFSDNIVSTKMKELGQITADQITVLEALDKNAFAIGMKGEAIFEEQIPWNIDSTLNPPTPLYLGRQFKLDCEICRTNCVSCPSNYFFIMNGFGKKSCYQTCPKNYIKEETLVNDVKVATGKCIKIDLDALPLAILKIRHRTANSAGKQPLDKPINLIMETTFDQKIKNLDPIANGILFNWDILEIYSADGIAFDSETIFEYKLEAKQSVTLNKQSLSIPLSQIKGGMVYIIQCTITQGTTVLSDIIKIQVEGTNIRITTLDGIDANINNNIEVKPREGISGETTFIVEYNFVTIPTFQESNKLWKFIIQTSTGLIIEKNNLSDYIAIPSPGNPNSDIMIEIKFSISDGTNTFTNIYQVRSLKNPAFSFNDDPTLSKFKGLNRRNMQQNDSGTPTNDANLSLSDFAQAGSIFKAAITDLQCNNIYEWETSGKIIKYGFCSIEEPTPCCGKGTCVQDSTRGEFFHICSCESGYEGKFCEINTSSKDQVKELIQNVAETLSTQVVDSSNSRNILSIISTVTDTGAVENEEVKKRMFDQIKDIGPTIQDANMLEQFANIFVKDLTQKSSEEQQKFASESFKAISEGVISTSKSILNEDEEEIILQLPELTIGMSKINVENLSTSGLSISLPGGTSDDGASVNIPRKKCKHGDTVSVIFSDSLHGSLPGATQSKKSFEINAIKYNGLPRTVSDPSLDPKKGECVTTVKFQLNKLENPQIKYQTSDGEFITEGCEIISQRKLEGFENMYEYEACLTHYSTFVVGEKDTQPAPSPSEPTKNNDQTQNNNEQAVSSPILIVSLVFLGSILHLLM